MDTILVLCLLSCSFFSLGHGWEVPTSIGRIRGKFEVLGQLGDCKFLGIPYAEPPVGDLRFKPPVPKQKLRDQPLEALKMGRICPQHEKHAKFFNFTDDPNSNFEISEDCLYMNIYVPTDAIGDIEQKTPVLFYIHSGGWTWGSASHYDPRWLSMYGKVVVVTFNYRLGILGFLTSENREVMNNGFKDIIHAFEWVHENIANFGGDPDRITVFGQSAGGATSVLLQAVPKLQGKVKRIIALGGLPSPIWSTSYLLENKNLPQEIAKLSRCHGDLVECLKSKSVEELIKLTINTTLSLRVLSAWVPWADSVDIDEMLGMRQSDFVRQGFKNIDFMGEMATSEGTTMASYMGSIQGIRIRSELTLEEIKSMCFLDDLVLDADAIMQRIAMNGRTSIPLAEATKFMTDYASFYPLYDVARTHEQSKASGKKTFVLVNGYASDDKRGLFPRPSWEKGAVHGDELPLVFGSHISPLRKKWSVSDNEMAKDVVKYISNFVKTGDPNKPEEVEVHWPEFTNEQSLKAQLSQSGISTGPFKFYTESPEYWDDVLAFSPIRTVQNPHEEL